MQLKKCSKCGEEKSIDAFAFRTAAKDGRQNNCRACGAEYQKLNASRRAELNLEWQRANPEKVRTKARKHALKKFYGLTVEQFDAILASQGGGCANCGRSDPNGRNWHVDHDHACCPSKQSCGQCICGILCSGCNTAIGLLNDDPDLIVATAAYVIRTRKNIPKGKKETRTNGELSHS